MTRRAPVTPDHPALRDVVEGTQLNRPIHSLDEAVVMSLLLTRKRMDLASQRFFQDREVTEAEFAALMVLYDYRKTPLKQAELARLLLVTRLSARDVLRRLERKGLIESAPHEDRRATAVRPTARGGEVLRRVRTAYYAMIARALAGMTDPQKEAFLAAHAAFRGSIHAGVPELLDRGAAPGG